MFTPEQIEMMNAPLDPSRIEHRRKAGLQLSYVESWSAIATANRILGYDGWSYTVDRLEPHGEVWIALVTVIVHGPQGGSISRQDVGVSIPAGGSKEAMETAIKGAVSDAQKRALRTLGDQWGLGLYDKDADHGSQDASPPRTEQRQERQQQQQEPPDLTVIQAGVWDRLKRDWQGAKVPKETVETNAKAYLHDVLHLEHWGQLNPAQWRDFEGAMRLAITGEEPGAPRTCPGCGGAMAERSGVSAKNNKPWRAWMCQAKCGASPIWME